MNKKLGRLLRPNMGWYMIVFLVFAIATAVFRNYLLAGIELIATAAVFMLYLTNRKSRKKRLQEFIQRHLDETAGMDGTKSPFPMMVIRLEDNGIVYANDSFIQLMGYQDTMGDRKVEEILPGFNTQWLISGKNEYAYDVTMQNRRYRVYGSTIRAEDPQSTMLGVLYFSDGLHADPQYLPERRHGCHCRSAAFCNP